MIDQDYLDGFGIKSEDIGKIQNEIMDSIRNRNFEELNSKYDSNMILHLSYDLVTQGKLSNVAKFSISGMEFSFVVNDNNPMK